MDAGILRLDTVKKVCARMELSFLIARCWIQWIDDHDVTPKFKLTLSNLMHQTAMKNHARGLHTIEKVMSANGITLVYTIQPEKVYDVILGLNADFPKDLIIEFKADIPYGETPERAKKPAEAAPIAAPIPETERAEDAKLAKAVKDAIEAEKVALDAAKKEGEDAKKLSDARAEALRRTEELRTATEDVKKSPRKSQIRKEMQKKVSKTKTLVDDATEKAIAAEASLKKATEEVRRTKQVALELRAIADALASAKATAITARKVAEEHVTEAKKVEDATVADAKVAEEEAEDAELIAADAAMRVTDAETAVRYAASAVVIEEMKLPVPKKALPVVPRRVIEAAPDPESVARAITAESREICPMVFEKSQFFADVIEQCGSLSKERARTVARMCDSSDVVSAIDTGALADDTMTHLVLWRALAKHVASERPITELSGFISEFNADLLEGSIEAITEDTKLCRAATADAAIPVTRERLDMTEAEFKKDLCELGKFVNARNADAHFDSIFCNWSPSSKQEFIDSIKEKRKYLSEIESAFDVYIDDMPIKEYIERVADL